ncbi:hypothetical protein AVEN_167337-1 [Araneus ventricosus]|uniref:Uncharacterized protein n=1 Tax=Araneus ventricosus TaxID=182803 RepID=A0A4Y2DDV4_ARAVE|nr:hypothetical protein AVEN_167337-1 [Araneus ventricosus]
MNNKEEISVQHLFNAANELPQRITEMIFQCTVALYSIKALPRRGQRPLSLLVDHTLHRTQYSPYPFSTVLTSFHFSWGLFEFPDLSSWGSVLDGFKRQHITVCADYVTFGRRECCEQDAMCGPLEGWSH